MNAAVKATLTTTLAGVFATVATWYLIGDLTTDPDAPGLSRVLTPPAIAPAVEHGMGILAILGLVGCGALLVRARTARLAGVLLAAAGALMGLLVRLLTVGTVDANIGAGLGVFSLVPSSAALVVCAIAAGIYSVRRHREPVAAG